MRVALALGFLALTILGAACRASPTPSPTPGNLTLTGRVYQVTGGGDRPVAGAKVSALMCVPRRFEATSGPDGSYSLDIPALYVNPCAQITLEVQAAGYQPISIVVSVPELRTQPQRNFALTLVGATGTPAP